MSLKRRTLIGMSAATAAAGLLLPAERGQTCRAIGFDAFTIFDPRSIAARAEKLFPGRGAILMDLWRTRQFEYSWLRTLTHTYADFRQVTEEALVYAAKALNVDLNGARKQQMLQSFGELRAWPDAAVALRKLNRSGVRLALLSNFTEEMMKAANESAGLSGLFEAYLSTDRVRAFKPDPRAYQVAVEALGLDRREIVFAAHAGWDAAGAKAFGYSTFWVNRTGLPAEELDFRPDAAGKSLDDLVRFAIGTPL